MAQWQRSACQEMQETWIQSLGQEDPLEKGMATRSSIPAWEIPWTVEPGGLQSVGSQRVRNDWSDLARMHRWFIHARIADFIHKFPLLFCALVIFWIRSNASDHSKSLCPRLWESLTQNLYSENEEFFYSLEKLKNFSILKDLTWGKKMQRTLAVLSRNLWGKPIIIEVIRND